MSLGSHSIFLHSDIAGVRVLEERVFESNISRNPQTVILRSDIH